MSSTPDTEPARRRAAPVLPPDEDLTRRWAPPAGLTLREVQVLALAARGFSNRQAADWLVVSPKTVANHLANAYRKAGVHTRIEARIFCVRHNLVPQVPTDPTD
jgi:DNA-binding NarL/FixJ family response regulator